MSRLSHSTRSYGFTMVELNVAMAIGAFILAGVVSTYLVCVKGFRAIANYAEIHKGGREAVNYFAKDMRAVNAINSFGSSTLTVTIPTNDQVPQYLNPAFCAARDYAADQGAKFTGPCFAIWHQAAAVHNDEVAEAAYPIDRALPGTDEVKVYELPQAQGKPTNVSTLQRNGGKIAYMLRVKRSKLLVCASSWASKAGKCLL